MLMCVSNEMAHCLQFQDNSSVPQEDAQLLEGHKKHGNKWTLIAQEIGGRTDNAVKNRFAALEKKRKGNVESEERCVVPRLSDLNAQTTNLRDQPRHRLVQGPWLEHQQYAYPPNFITQPIGKTLLRSLLTCLATLVYDYVLVCPMVVFSCQGVC